MSNSLLLVSVGNTRTRFALAREGQLEPSRVLSNADAQGLIAGLGEADAGADEPAPALVASVNEAVAERVEAALRAGGRSVVRFGRDAPIPVTHSLDEDAGAGQDRLLGAIGAFSRAKSACVVIDAGTAITVDFVDGEGTFHGGAIAPGLNMMLRSMHEGTSALPLIALDPGALPADGAPPFGKNTAQAMTLGAVAAARGLAHLLIDRYAEFYEAYPRVIATGGDAPLLFGSDPLVEHVVPDLTLVGMLEAYRRLEELENAEEDDRE